MLRLSLRRPIIHDVHVGARHAEDTSRADLQSGPGAVMFEPGANARIRRAPVRAIASMTWRGGPREIFGQVLNVSPGGCLVRTETTIPEGTVLDIAVTLVGGQQRSHADVRGLVRHVTTYEGRKAYGVEFIAQDSLERETLQWLYTQAVEQR